MQYSTQHVPIHLLEEWRKNLDSNYAIGAVFMNLSQAFDCITHDLLITKLGPSGLEQKVLNYI